MRMKVIRMNGVEAKTPALRGLLAVVVMAAFVVAIAWPESAMAQRGGRRSGGRGSVHFGGGGRGGPGGAAGPGGGGNNRGAFSAGLHAGRHQGYNRGVQHGYRHGSSHGAHRWAYRAPTTWGFHPFGFFVATLATTAIIVAIVDDDGNSSSSGNVSYSEGQYYEKTDDGYKVIPPPAGAQIASLPEGYTAVSVGDDQYSYYQGDFYVPSGDKYVITAAPAGAIVPYIPDVATETDQDGIKSYEFNGVTYQAVSISGQTSYLVTETAAATGSQANGR